MKKTKDLSVRGQIRTNNKKVINVVILIIVLIMVNLLLIDWYQNRLHVYNDQADAIRDAEILEYGWLDGIAIGSGGEVDAEQCTYTEWYNNREKAKDGAVKELIETTQEQHQKLHNIAQKIKETENDIVKLNKQAQLRTESVKFFENMEQVYTKYEGYAQGAQTSLLFHVIFGIISSVVLAVVAVLIATKRGNKLAAKISEPISAVAEWSRELSAGSTNLDFAESSQTQTDLTEVRVMIESFQAMAESIEENVRVVQKVADGDMTAFVNIRSASDSLGKNLYRMVQSNDFMFAEISGIADSVAHGAENIAKASGALAESCSVQAGAVKEFADVVEETGVFINENNEKAQDAMKVSDEIKNEVQESTSKMNELLGAMEEIRAASERVSDIIRTIDDIAGQTNLLALNAAIEAARAGEAGKGFAVVAEEVKDLAAESAKAAEESRQLIEDTINKTVFGDNISKETSESFGSITESIRRIVSIIDEIAQAGEKQKEHIYGVQQNIHEIADAIDGNAASSEEAAAASDELNNSADELKEAMQKFNLRKRTPGQPYIPPEKQDDIEFIKEAEDNYRKAREEGKVIV